VYNIVAKYISILLGALFIFGCSQPEHSKKRVVAQVSEKKLFASDLTAIIPTSIGINDSAIIANDYINKWVKQELLLQKANENLSTTQKNVTHELEEYRNSLIIYKYKNELIKQRMDTTVTNEQIENYYNSNKVAFNLTKNIAKAIFVKIPNEVANPALLKSLTANTTEEGLTELKEYCLQYAKGFDIFINNWVDFETLKNNIPQKINDEERFLSQNNLIELNDSNYYYLVRIHDYKLRNELAPQEFVRNNIKRLILNRRKIDFLKQIEDNIYKEGIRKNKFSIKVR
jgi:PBP1b-binding outer membrane lipoprotein LpoB